MWDKLPPNIRKIYYACIIKFEENPKNEHVLGQSLFFVKQAMNMGIFEFQVLVIGSKGLV